MKLEILEKIKNLSKKAYEAQKSAEKWNMKCMDLPPRMWVRWWRNTSIQAKASVNARYRDEVMHELRLAMSEFIKNY